GHRSAQPDRARNHDHHGNFRGLCADLPVSADLFLGGLHPLLSLTMAATNQILPQDPVQEISKARALAERYYHEFVDLKETRIDHDLFHSIPVDLMFRYN